MNDNHNDQKCCETSPSRCAMLTNVDKGLRFLADFDVFGNLSTLAYAGTIYLEIEAPYKAQQMIA